MAVATLSLGGCSQSPPHEPPMDFAADRLPGELESAPDEAARQYVHPQWGFAFAAPPGWTITDETDDAVVLADPTKRRALHVTASRDGRRQAFQAAVAGFRKRSRDRHEFILDDDDYRAATTDSNGQHIRVRILRGSAGTITARIHYPAADAVTLDAAASATLDSLVWQASN